MKKKGFTIVEMLAVIAILALIIIIAVPTYLKSAANSRESLYQSKIETIKTKAIEYAQDNSIDYTTISVTELVLEGYLSADTDDADNHNLIKNPRDNSSLDCYHVNIRKDSGEYNADVEESTSCELANLEENQKKISIEYYDKDCNKLVGEWKNKDVLVLLNLNDIQDKLTMEGAKTNITWSYGAQSNDKKKGITNVCNPNVDDYANEYFVTATKYLDTTYNVAIPIIYDVTIPTSNGILTKKINVRIDREEPFVLTAADQSWVAAAEMEEIDGHKVGKTKKITVMGSDGSGSGVSAYYLTESSIPENNKYEVITQGAWELDTNPTHQFEVDHNGIYYVYVKDNAGNISKAAPISVSGFDTTLPQCGMNVVTSDGVPIDQNTWTNKDVKVTFGCVQGETSGCATDNGVNSTQVYTNYQLVDIPERTIYDNAGNSQSCKGQRVQVLIDKDYPVCTKTNVPSDWVNTSYSVSYGCKDVDDPMTSGTGISGCKDKDGNNTANQEVIYGTKGPYTSGSHYERLSYIISDVAGNVTDCSKDDKMQYTAKVDTEAPTLSVKVNNTTYTDTSDNYVYADTITRTVIATDQSNLSGIDKVQYCEGTCTNSSSGWTNLSSMSLSIPQSATSEDRTFRAIDNVGNISNLVHVKLQYKECSNSSYKTLRTTSTGACSKDCGGGTQTVTSYYKDSYTGTSCSNFTSTSSQSCNTQSCCSSTYSSYGSYGSCSAGSCGSGTKYRTVTYYSNYDDSYCSSTTQSTSCCGSGGCSCCSSTYNEYGSYGSCSVSTCGKGTKKRTVYQYSTADDSYCGYTTESTSCCGPDGCTCSTPEPEENPICEYKNGKYYDDKGNVVTKSVYESKCTTQEPCTCTAERYKNGKCSNCKTKSDWQKKCSEACSKISDAEGNSTGPNVNNNYNNTTADYNAGYCRCQYRYYHFTNRHGDEIYTNSAVEAQNVQVAFGEDSYHYRDSGYVSNFCYRYVRRLSWAPNLVAAGHAYGTAGDAYYHIYFDTKKTGLLMYENEYTLTDYHQEIYMPASGCKGFGSY